MVNDVKIPWSSISMSMQKHGVLAGLHEMLPFSLHGYRMSVHTSTGATPYSPVYGMNVVLPIEVEILSLSVIMEAYLDEAEWMQSRYDQLNLIKEKRFTVVYHGQLYQ